MRDDYLITIHGTIEQETGSDSVKLMTRGSFVQRGGKYFISYRESETTGFIGCTTMVKVEGQARVSMTRVGPMPSQIIIEKGRRHVCHYDTSHGALSLGVSADEIESRLTSKGGKLRFSYSLDVDTESLSRNIVDITVKPVQ